MTSKLSLSKHGGSKILQYKYDIFGGNDLLYDQSRIILAA